MEDAIAAARIIEPAAARNLLDYAGAFQRAGSELTPSAIRCAGGIAAFTGVESPLTTVKGAGPEIVDEDIDRAEAFFRHHAAERVVFELAPWVAAGVDALLTRRGYAITSIETVMVREAPLTAQAARQCVREMDRGLWVDLLLKAYELPDNPAWRRLASAAADLPQAMNLGVFDASQLPQGGWVAAAQVVPTLGVAIFSNDATIPLVRRRGYQTALIRERLRHAATFDVTCAAAEVDPGSASERNYLRCGFRPVYTRSHYSRSLH